MVKKKGDHFKRKEMKSSILEFILENNGSVGEPVIREHLHKKHEVIDQGDINRHLHNLQDLDCIELISPIKTGTKKSGLRNYWDIKKLKHLKNIRLHFPEIKLNTCEKSFIIIIKELFPNIDALNTKKFCIQLFLSASLFDVYLKTDIETLDSKAYDIYQYGEGSDEIKLIEGYISYIYNLYLESVLINSSIWLAAYNKYINDSLKSEVYLNSLKSSLDIIISYETFRNILEEIPFQIPEESSEEQNRRITKDMSLKMSEKIFQKMLKKLPVELPEIPEGIYNQMSKDVLKQISDKIFEKLFEQIQEDTLNKILKIKSCQHRIYLRTSDIIFEECHRIDILYGTVSLEEKRFMKGTKNIRDYIKKGIAKDPISEYQAYDCFYDEYFR